MEKRKDLQEMIFERLATAKLNKSMLDVVLDDLLRMSEGKKHVSSLVSFIIMSMQMRSETQYA